MNPTLHAQILTLRKYQAWRTGKDARTMGEVGIKPAAVTSALDAVIAIAENHLRDGMKKAEPVNVPSDGFVRVLKLALEYWTDRQQRYKNRAPVWVQEARALLEKCGTQK